MSTKQDHSGQMQNKLLDRDTCLASRGFKRSISGPWLKELCTTDLNYLRLLWTSRADGYGQYWRHISESWFPI